MLKGYRLISYKASMKVKRQCSKNKLSITCKDTCNERCKLFSNHKESKWRLEQKI